MRGAAAQRWCTRFGTTVELHLVRCIVQSPPPANGPRALVNSANEALQGTALPYFPMASAPPRELLTSSWGGMEAGPNMFYATQVVDGITGIMGGSELRQACEALPELAPGVRCRVGGAVVTQATGGLVEHFDAVIHTVAPMHSHKADATEWRSLLLESYNSALTALWQPATEHKHDAVTTIVSPLVGAGARGGDVEEVADVFAEAVSEWQPITASVVVQMAVIEPLNAEAVAKALNKRRTTLLG